MMNIELSTKVVLSSTLVLFLSPNMLYNHGCEYVILMT